MPYPYEKSFIIKVQGDKPELLNLMPRAAMLTGDWGIPEEAECITVTELELEIKNLRESNIFKSKQIENLEDEVSNLKAELKNADANILKLADSYNGLNRVHVEALKKLNVINNLLTLYPDGVYVGEWGTDSDNLELWVNKLREALK